MKTNYKKHFNCTYQSRVLKKPYKVFEPTTYAKT